MSAPPPYSQQRSNTEVPDACRDYLRTGRCKYGSSCKYYHPPNVQTGGGMKAPVDPSEPMFPLRPTEPICQYYIKHGTCKFGQACKFNHPPAQQQLQAVVNNSRGGTVMMNVGGRPTEAPQQQLVLNPVGTDPNGPMMLQFLPQRPDEPDCIYFLKNGRCKYGATCRYHHPVNYLQQQQQRQRRVDDSTARRGRMPSHDPYRPQQQNVQYVGQLVPATYAQGQVQVSDGGPVSVLNLDAQRGFQPLPIVSNSDGTTSYTVPVTDQGSSASSIASSSYETAVSNLEARRSASGGCLSSYANADSSGGQARTNAMPALHSSASEGNMARRNRSTSYGSASDTSYYDSTITSTSRNTSVGSWRDPPATDMRRVPPGQYVTRPDGMPPTGSSGNEYSQYARARVPVSGGGARPRRNSRRGPGQGGGDEGFTMMTSALLNMLDTPEEVGAAYDEDDPRVVYATYPPGHEGIDPAYFERLSLQDAGSSAGPHIGLQGQVDPSWHANEGASSAGRPARSNDEAMQMMPHHHHANGPPSHSHHSGSDVGLYLP